MKLSATEARRLILAAQGLDGAWKPAKATEGAAQVVERLGYVQIDTIAVVERAHHHTLWSRCADYAPWMLDELQAKQRRVFEYWWHAASYLPMTDYRYSLPRMQAFRAAPRMQGYLKENRALLESVLERIRKEGPLRSADFATPPGTRRGTWWDWKPAKRALEALFSIGELMIAERRSFQRVYDLPERVLPESVDTHEPSADELARFVVRQVSVTQGVSALQQRQLRDRRRVATALKELVDSGEITPVDVEGMDGRTLYALTRALEQAAKRSRRRRRLHILSPFDNLVIWRDRLRDFFDFDCRLEAYIPEAQREHGYFCLPILWGDAFVGRLDPKAERGQRTLVVKRLMLEPGFRQHDVLLPELARKLHAFARFNGCEQVRIQATVPKKFGAPLRRELRTAG